jgi:aldehyde:ferredoxin oxidoreductase
VFNLQRAILAREGHQGRDGDQAPARCFKEPVKFDQVNPDCLVSGRNGEVMSRKGAVLDREEFEKMKSEYYEIRGWDVASGRQTRASLAEAGLRDIAADLEGRGLLGAG